ncbi:MAG: hypothetical protein K0S83_408, partial [Thermomicrobiales bacterium]|nr:hypothetical protein [Thermomicrobiales bacterium]
TLNQLVEGSSPSRLTNDLRGNKRPSRATRRGSSVLSEQPATESVLKNVEC